MTVAPAVVAWLLASVASPAARPFCERPADCGAGGVCVAGLCRSGADRTSVAPLYPIAVPTPFVLGDDPRLRASAEELAGRIRRALAWTGFYDVLPPDSAPVGWASEGLSPSETRRLAWQAAGAYRVLKVLVEPEDVGAFRARLRLVEVERFGEVDLGVSELVVRPGGVASAAARWVDALVALDTGIPGTSGTRLAVSVQTGPGVKEIAIIDATGGVPILVTANGSLNLGPAWALDGRLGYMSYRSGNADWVVDGQPLSTRPGLNAAGAFSPDGRLLALSIAEGDNSDIFVLYADIGEEHLRLTDHPAVDTSPAWAPDGRRLAFVSDRTGSPQIWIGALDGAEFRRLPISGYVTSPAWSPDGLAIACVQRTGGAGFAVLRYDLQTDRLTRLTGSEMSAESPAWSPHGRYLIFARSDVAGGPRLWLMNADGGHPRPIDSGPWPTFAPDWRP